MAGVEKTIHKKCPHGRQPYHCRDCGGKLFCMHGKNKYRCLDCDGRAFCQHKCRKEACVLCGGASICQHKKRRDTCIICGGSSLCEHGRQKSQCSDCGGVGVCEHRKRRDRCALCCGVGICEHRKMQRYCKICGGSGICEHNKQKYACAECQNFVCELGTCTGQRFSTAFNLKNHMRAFHSDDPKALTKHKELTVHQFLRTSGVDFEYQFCIPFARCGLDGETKYAFLDFLIPRQWGHICLEVDENQHSAYDESCDPRRDFDIFSSIALGTGGKVLILRYNPDGFKIGDMTCSVAKKARHARLLEVINSVEPPACARYFLYYNKHKHGDELPAVADQWPPAMREMSKAL